MRRFTRLQRILILIITFFLILGCVMLSLRQNSLTNLGYSAWTYIKYGLFEQPLTSFGNMVSDVSNLWHVYDENEYLNEQLANQRSYQTLYEEEKNRTSELEGLLDIQDPSSEALVVSARVISRPVYAWDQTVTISAGSSSGITPNMIVCSSQGAIGLVEEVQDNTSIVRLLTSNEMINDIAVQISMDDGSSIQGVLRGYNAEKNRYEIVLFDHEATVSQGQLVATSGKGGNYPDGLMIGTVTGTQLNDDAIISTVFVQPVNNISSFNYVKVIGNGVVE